MFLYRFIENGTLILTHEDKNGNCSAIIGESVTASVKVKTNKDYPLAPAVIVDTTNYIKTLWNEPPKIPNTNYAIPYYNAIQTDLLNNAKANPATNTGGYWEFSVWDKSLMAGNGPTDNGPTDNGPTDNGPNNMIRTKPRVKRSKPAAPKPVAPAIGFFPYIR